VLSFATAAKEWASVEHDAGHFLYAVERVRLQPLAVVQPPDKDKSTENATTSFKRITRWFDKAGVRTIELDELADPQLALIGEADEPDRLLLIGPHSLEWSLTRRTSLTEVH
jgi:hypothetical protein